MSKPCTLPPAIQEQLEMDLVVYGNWYKYKCDCGQFHRIDPTRLFFARDEVLAPPGKSIAESLQDAEDRGTLTERERIQQMLGDY